MPEEPLPFQETLHIQQVLKKLIQRLLINKVSDAYQ